MLLSAAMLFACPGALVFSEIHIAAIALLWAQFCLLKEEYFAPAPKDMLNDAFLGLSVVVLGLVIWVVILLIKDPKGVIKKALLRKND